MNSRILCGIQWYLSAFDGRLRLLRLRFRGHCGIIKLISTTIQKLKSDYKPLGVAVFLAVGGLLSGLIWSFVFVSGPAGMIQEHRTPGSPLLIPQAEGAEIDSAALTPQSAPFLASANSGADNLQVAENVDTLYGQGALKDSEPVVKTNTTNPATGSVKELAAGIIYTAAANDTLRSISAAFKVPMNTIVEFNPSVNFSPLEPGVSIVIPGTNDI